ncbi:NTP transferase domain-containing protein [Sorangium sp. So ce1182]|uniref:NTP transferase domain-containing protein n=1 Tax=Sorangium sp. So ce1182 TaxID=3133334 RepID=UPI003F5FD5DC
MKVITIVLAAGAGKRLGGPKALLAWPAATKGGAERPLAIAHAEARLEAESARVLVVVRSSVFHALLAHVRPGVDLVSWTAPDDLGPAGSLAVAAPRIGDADAVVVTPVDVPPASSATVARLLARLDAGASSAAPPLAVRPRHLGRGGHPVVLRAEALQRYLEADPPPLRDHLRALGNRCVDEEVDDPGVLHDLNVPVDVIRVLGGPPRFLA